MLMYTARTFPLLLATLLAGCVHRASDSAAMERDFEACKALVETAATRDFKASTVEYASEGTYRISEDDEAIIEIDVTLRGKSRALHKSALCTLPWFGKEQLVLTDPVLK
ncbi:hypothetical protein [Pseudomonas sp. RIT-PI-AD]|uniref:hypothetical protein n=1 Tax=Pseudomonas sp. RIT-PI-AD TaxID=3035294 RepID=UPI0021DA5742|nr:hypothetical protein [Pseudomonas sp. RIT-PI-AD]